VSDTLKVLIVDDEKLIRSLVRSCIDWGALGMEIAGEAESATEALAEVEALLPDVIFTDIYMPLMNGLELSSRVKQRWPDIEIVLLTGYEEFEFAQAGIKLGVTDFLLKPVDPGEIQKTAEKIREKILSRKNQSSEFERIQAMLKANQPLFRERRMQGLLTGEEPVETLTGDLRFYGVELKPDYCQIALILTECVKPPEDEAAQALLERIRVQELATQFFARSKGIHVFGDSNRHVVVLDNLGESSLHDACETLLSVLANRLNSQISVGIGCAHPKLELAARSYQEALDALDYRLIAGNGHVVSYRDIHPTRRDTGVADDASLREFAALLRSGRADALTRWIDWTFARAQGISPSREGLFVLGCQILTTVLGVLVELNLDRLEVFQADPHFFENFFLQATLDEMHVYLLGITLRAAEAVVQAAGSQKRQLAASARAYLEQNFVDPELTLSTVSGELFVNASYLSRIFKEETGESFINCLLRLRMERAKRLIRDTDLMSYQVAQEVGIQDPQYFCVLFKKYTGMLVREYKKGPSDGKR
jgi:two-component system response regulator YesN